MNGPPLVTDKAATWAIDPTVADLERLLRRPAGSLRDRMRSIVTNCHVQAARADARASTKRSARRTVADATALEALGKLRAVIDDRTSLPALARAANGLRRAGHGQADVIDELIRALLTVPATTAVVEQAAEGKAGAPGKVYQRKFLAELARHWRDVTGVAPAKASRPAAVRRSPRALFLPFAEAALADVSVEVKNVARAIQQVLSDVDK